MATRKKNDSTPADPPEMTDVPPPIPGDGGEEAGPAVHFDEGATPVSTVKAPVAKHTISASILSPDLHSVATVARRYKFWIGVHWDCPVESIGAAGFAFSKVNEKVVPNRDLSGRKQRIPMIGSLVNIDRDQMIRLAKALRRIIVRFREPDAARAAAEPYGIKKIEDATDPEIVRPRGRLITIPTAESLKAAEAKGRVARRYIPQPNDHPAVRWMFIQMCADQVNGSRSDAYPESIETTGLPWPWDEPCPEI